MEKIKNIFDYLKKLDKNILNLMKKGFKFSFYFSILSTLFLIVYNIYNQPIIYITGISLFKTSLFFAVDFVICGVAFDKIKKEIT